MSHIIDNLDRGILLALKNKSLYYQLSTLVSEDIFGTDTVNMLKWYGVYFKNNPELDYIDTDELATLISVRNTYQSDDDKAVMSTLLMSIQGTAREEFVSSLADNLITANAVGRIQACINQYTQGKEVPILENIAEEVQKAVMHIDAYNNNDRSKYDIDTILDNIAGDRGLKFCTEGLQSHVQGLIAGDSVLIAARPDKGKTSFLASNAVHFAKQSRALGYGDRPILWLNNEGSGIKIIPRVYQASLRITFDELVELKRAGKLNAKYEKAVDGVDIIVEDVHGWDLRAVEKLIRKYKPFVVIYDMVANFKTIGTHDSKTDALESKWQRIREAGVQYDHIPIGTSQISYDGDNQAYPSYSHLKDSKTAVQGATELIIMIGSVDNDKATDIRYISTPKNKKKMEGKPSLLREEVYFDASRCVFK